MKKRIPGPVAALLCASFILCANKALAQNQRGDWPLNGEDAGQAGVQKDEVVLSPESVASDFKFLWKIKLGQPSKTAATFSEPLLAGRLINSHGFKDLVYWSTSDTLYAVDSELGAMVWTKRYDTQTAKPAPGCGVSSLSLLMEPPAVINFNARRPRTAVAAAPPPPPPPVEAKSSERKLGLAPGGGYFGFKGIYVLTPDGMLHEQVMSTGADFASPVKFLPAANASAYGLNFAEKTIFTATGHDCGGVANGIWAINLSDGNYTVTNYATEKVRPLALSGPVLTPDGKAIFITAAGTSDPGGQVYPGSVVALGKDMKVEDWYTPESGMGAYEGVSPATFNYKGRQLVVAPGKDGNVALLDASSLGGADHHTPLAEIPVANAGEKHGWDGFAAWQDKDGTAWVYASVAAGVSVNGSNLQHGAVVAFKLDDADGKLSLAPAWVSQDMVNPAPPRISNGVLVALAGGDPANHAVLYVLNAQTGAELYSSKSQIPTYTRLSGVSIGDSHAFFTDHDNVLYSFGIGIEH